MFTFRVQIIAVLSLVIGSIGSEANNNLTTSLETEGAEEPDDYEKEEPSTNRNWDCQPDSHFIQEQISLTTKLLHDGEDFIKTQQFPSADETVLVLGRAGSGKTSLVQFLTDNDKLHAKQINPNTGEYIFEDGEKIGTSATESFTLYPEIVNFNSTVNFCDPPGFHDSRSSAHEIVSMNAMKSITKNFGKTKILIVEAHALLQYGVAKDSFIRTLRFVNDFVVDIDKYKDHLAIIASKVPLSYEVTDDIDVAGKIVTDEMLVESIVSFLNHTEISLTERLRFKKSKTDEEFFKKVITLLKSLQTRDENGKPTRINVFRRPYKSGSFKTMKLLVKNRESILQTVFNLNSVEVKPNDFDYTLSNAAKMYLECILELTSDNYKSKINELSFKLTDYITQNTQNYTSFYQVLLDLDELHESLKRLSQNLENTTNYNEFFEIVNTFLTDHKIPIQYEFNGRAHVLEKYEEMLLKFVDISRMFIPSSWTLPIRQVVKSVKDELKWYQTLDKLIRGLSAYEIQSNKSEIYNTIFRESSTSTNNLMTLFMSVTESKDLEQFMKARGDARKSREMELITNSLLKDNHITCDINGKLIVKGFLIRLSEINSEKLVRIFCNDTKLTEVALLAVDTVYLDEDTVDLFEGVNMFIAAPRWQVIGERKIVLSGEIGPRIVGEIFVDNGKNGKPGLPGGNGGNFFGIGLCFSNGRNLKIETNGGRGGRGADGGKGERGEDGQDGVMRVINELRGSRTRNLLTQSRIDVNNGYESENVTLDILINNAGEPKPFILHEDINRCVRQNHIEPLTCMKVSTRLTSYRYEGECGRGGALGGWGGHAGLGGNPGNHKLVELGDSSWIYLESLVGSRGTHGDMGQTGDRGSNGIAITCYNLKGGLGYSFPSRITSYWRCFDSDDSHVTSCDKGPELNTPQEHSKTGMKEPSPSSNIDFGYNLYQFALLLYRHRENPMFHKTIEDFIKAYKEKKQSRNLDDLVTF